MVVLPVLLQATIHKTSFCFFRRPNHDARLRSCRNRKNRDKPSTEVSIFMKLPSDSNRTRYPRPEPRLAKYRPGRNRQGKDKSAFTRNPPPPKGRSPPLPPCPWSPGKARIAEPVPAEVHAVLAQGLRGTMIRPYPVVRHIGIHAEKCTLLGIYGDPAGQGSSLTLQQAPRTPGSDGYNLSTGPADAAGGPVSGHRAYPAFLTNFLLRRKRVRNAGYRHCILGSRFSATPADHQRKNISTQLATTRPAAAIRPRKTLIPPSGQ